MDCPICKKYLGKHVLHANGECPQASSVLCRRCHTRGHMTSHCTESWPHYERPTSLEELIPAYLRHRYGVTTHTPLEFSTPRALPDTDKELHDANVVEVPEEYNLMKEFLEKHNIKVEKVTKEPFVKCREALLAWGVSRGHRIVLVPSHS